MWIKDQSGEMLVNLDDVAHIAINERSICVLSKAMAIVGGEDTPVLDIGEYKNANRTKQVFTQIEAAIVAGEKVFIMPKEK